MENYKLNSQVKIFLDEDELKILSNLINSASNVLMFFDIFSVSHS